MKRGGSLDGIEPFPTLSTVGLFLGFGRLPLPAEATRTSTAWGPSEPGTKPPGLKALRELLHRLDAAGFEPLGDRNGVGVRLDTGDEVTDKFR